MGWARAPRSLLAVACHRSRATGSGARHPRCETFDQKPLYLNLLRINGGAVRVEDPSPMELVRGNEDPLRERVRAAYDRVVRARNAPSFNATKP